MSDKLVEILADITGLRPDMITPETRSGYCCDEYDFYDPAKVIEEEYGINIPEEEMMKLYTAGDLQAYIEKAA